MLTKAYSSRQQELDDTALARVADDGYVYLHGSESVDGSVRLSWTGSPESKIQWEKRTSGVWAVATDIGSQGLKMRPAARFRGITAASHYGRVSWAPTTQAFEIAWTMQTSDVSSATSRFFFGLTGSGEINVFRLGTTATCRIRLGSTPFADSATGYFLGDALPHRYRIVWGSSVVTFYRDGVQFSQTALSGTASTTPYNFDIGAAVGTVNQQDCLMWDVELKDPASAANTAYYKLDESTGSFANSAAGSSVAAATRNGLVQMQPVLTSGDSRANVEATNPSYVSANADGAQTMDGSAQSAYSVVWSTEEHDPANRLSTAVYSAERTGFALVTANLTLSLGATAADLVDVSIQKDNSDVGDIVRVNVPTSDSVNLSITKLVPIVSGSSIRIRVSAIAASSTGLTVARGNLTVEAYALA